MNYYAQGGQAQGIKSLARELPNYGRYNDDMVAHISSDEARLLKSLGGAGTINPVTGLPEFGWFKKATGISTPKFIKKVDDAVVQPIAGAAKDIVKPILPYVQYIAPFIPGVGPLMAAGLGALGSGFAGGGGFNFKRGLMGGMTAYGLSNMYAGMQAAGGATPGAVPTGAEVAPVELGVPGSEVVAGEVAQTGLSTPGAFDQVMAGDFSGAASTVGDSVSQGISSAYNTVTDPNTYANMGDKFTTQMSDAGQGLKNLTGVGETTMSSGDALKAVGSQFGTGSAMGIYGGVTGAQALDEYDEMKLQADLANAKSQEEYDAIMARIEASRQRGVEAMKANPYQFAYGGSVDDEAGFDDFNDYMGGGIASMAQGGMPPRFLSGGGDGMSDGIKATINGKQPARLADGEFVIPADVVSHLGNGSSKAGAKKLYSMMDKVRHARTGNKKQGKQINPNKFLLA
jgi:hypothetical protein